MKINIDKLILLFLISTIFYSVKIRAQGTELNRTVNWRFGHAAGLNFDKNNNYQASVFTGSHGITYEGNASISDTDGNLLFYCNGDTLWNSLHEPMVNGAGLLCDKNTKVSSQIIPRPGSSTQYFVFVNGCIADQCNNGLRYSVVDMTLDNGKGAVVSGQKNMLVMPNAYQGMAITKHSNGIDYWLAYSKYFAPPQNTQRLLMIPITSAGPDTNLTVVSPFSAEPISGSGRFSPNGQIFNRGVGEFYLFNNSTGQLSNKIRPKNDSIAIGTNYLTYGYEFSPNNRFFYVTLNEGLGRNCIQQYDLSVFDSAAISNSIYSWQIYFGPPIFRGLAHMQLGPDGKIYIAVPGGGNDSIHVIHNPNLLGAACNFEYNSVALERACNFSMTVYPDYYFNNIVTSLNYPMPAENVISIYPNPADEVITINHKYTANYSYVIYDFQGKEIRQMQGNRLINSINISDLLNGIYYLQIFSGNHYNISRKFIINH